MLDDLNQKRMRKKVGSVIKIARAGEETCEVSFSEGKTLASYFEDADITLASSEEIYVESEAADLEDVLEAGDLVQIVGKKEGGC